MARWFVFSGANENPDGRLVIKGHLRGYRTKPVLDTDNYKINATPQKTEIRVRLHHGNLWAEIDARTVSDARDMRIVLKRGADVSVLPGIVPDIAPMEGVLAGWDQVSVWMLCFLSSRLEGDNVQINNFEMAHFERVGDPSQPDKPQIDKVELRGQHVGAHRDSCSLIVAGRRLVEVVITVRYDVDAQNSYLIPIQVGLFGDRATVSTALVRDVSDTATTGLHKILVAKVKRALESEVSAESLGNLPERILERAEQATPAEEADLFAHQADAEHEDATEETVEA